MRRLPLAAITAALLCLISMVLAPSANAAPGKNPVVGHRNDRVCAGAPANQASCHAIRHDPVDASGNVVPDSVAGPKGLGSQELQDAYKITGKVSGGKTVAIVDAYDAVAAYEDLIQYRQTMGLTPCSNTAIAPDTVPCFRKVNQTGQAAPLPKADGGWGQEISLDLDMVSAACPDCKILLVEANTASFADLAAAVKTAAAMGATAISNSYGGNDTNAYASSYTIAGVAVTASSGDNGYGVEAPASFPGVVSVGGTSLTAASNARGWAETAWNGAGSGCSRWNSTTWQNTKLTGCSRKATADVAAVADPNTGVAVYDSTPYGGASGWLVFGGTSVASPIIASVYALAGNYNATTSAGAYTWQNANTAVSTGNLFDVTSGSNGRCSTKKLCTAGTGWDGPTGLGTPNGLGAF